VNDRDPWTRGRIAALVTGALVGLFGLVLLGCGGAALWAQLTQRESGYVTSDVHSFSTGGSALATRSTELGTAGLGWLYGPGLLDKVRVRVTPDGGSPTFVGIARSADADRYLDGVRHSVIREFWNEDVKQVDGARQPAAPGTRHFWVASSAGSGPRTVVWKPRDGSWTVVVMNADARPGVNVEADLGARLPALPWIGLGFLVAGAVFTAGGVLLVAGAIRRRRAALAPAG
jgi:hypothetical protein